MIVPADIEDTDAILGLLEAIGRKRGCIVSGGEKILARPQAFPEGVCVRASWGD